MTDTKEVSDSDRMWYGSLISELETIQNRAKHLIHDITEDSVRQYLNIYTDNTFASVPSGIKVVDAIEQLQEDEWPVFDSDLLVRSLFILSGD